MLYFLGFVLRSTTAFGLIRCSNLPIRIIPFLLVSPIVVFFWGWDPSFVIIRTCSFPFHPLSWLTCSGDQGLTVWSVVVSLFMMLIGAGIIRYWTLSSQDLDDLVTTLREDEGTFSIPLQFKSSFLL
jgi:hypothetical protein